jgi:hypothetical protein
MTKHIDLPLSDLVHAMTFQRKAAGRVLDEATQRVQMVFRQKLRAAQRFIVGDDSVRLVCHLSHEQNRLEAWSFLARLPYDTVWFEFSLHEKVKEFERMGTLRQPFDPANVAQRMGLLLWKDTTDERNPRWVAHTFVKTTDGMISPDMLAYVFHPEGDMRFPTRGSDFWHAPTLSLIPGLPRLPVSIFADDGKKIQTECDPEIVLGGLIGTEGGSYPLYEHNHGWMHLQVPEDDNKASMISGPDWFTPRMAAIVNPWWEAHLRHRYKDNRERWNKLILHEVQENAGHLRWLITLLASINGIPKTIRPLPARTGKRSLGMYQVPYFSHNIVDLTIPAEDKVLYARSKLNKAASNVHRAAHPVRGHWRVIERGKRAYICRHDPVMVEHGLGMCSKCQLMIRWITDYHTGTPMVGVTTHEYNVKT